MKKSICFSGGIIHDGINEEGYKADLLVENGIIKEISSKIEIIEEMEVIDVTGKFIYPGFIDAHSHLGLDGYGVGFEGQDYNEMNDIICPQLRGLDSINPQDITFKMAAREGVTCVATGPGSANVLGGTFVAIKTTGNCVDEMVIKDGIAMKCAFGENPKRCYKDKNNYARMSTASKLREMLFKAREYMEKKELAGDDVSKKPNFDFKLEALIPVLKREMPLKAHAHRADDICTAIRIAKEFDVKLTLEHVTEGHLIVDKLVKANYPLAVGPSLGHATKVELREKTFKTPGILANAGCQVSIITDAPVIPQGYLAMCAGLAVKDGMKPFHALQAITINPAKHIGIADRVGSLEIGKDGDLVITDGNPMEISTNICEVYIEGIKQ